MRVPGDFPTFHPQPPKGGLFKRGASLDSRRFAECRGIPDEREDMVRCWCYRAMSECLHVWDDEDEMAAHARRWQWQSECERAGGDCAARVEAVALRLPGVQAVRKGSVLQLYTVAARVEFIDGAGGACAEYRYLGLIEPTLQHLVWRRDGPRGGGVRFILVDEFTGAQSELDALAQLPLARAVTMAKTLAGHLLV
jgi:hypothetical protein